MYAIRVAPRSSNRAIAIAGSLYTQKPLARSAIAWCSPPAMLTARSARPDQTSSAAASVAPATRAAASCIPGNTGLSGVSSPYPGPPRLTASMYARS